MLKPHPLHLFAISYLRRRSVAKTTMGVTIVYQDL